MLPISLLITVTVCYLSLLFFIAFIGDKYQLPKRFKPVVYSLGLGVYCTSWAFFGVTGQAATTGWWLTPTYAGAIIAFIFAWPLVLKVAKICRQQSLTSLADFISSRYGKSTRLAGLITLVSVCAIIPYIALQLRAMTDSFTAVTQYQSISGWVDISLVFTVMLAIFAILFGTRRIRPSEQNPGLLLAIGFESIVKLFTFLLVGIFVCFWIFSSPAELLDAAYEHQAIKSISPPPGYVYLTQTLLGVLMMFCLPRQFHMAFIEQKSESELNSARWLFPVFLIALNIFALPIAFAGLITFADQSVGSDSFMLQLPIYANNDFMILVSYLGGFSAATSMVIVATIVLSIMVSNDLITPKLLAREQGSRRTLLGSQQLSPDRLLIIRRITIAIILIAAWAYYQSISNSELLAVTGLMAMTLVAQFAPAMILGLVWSKANHKAAYRSIVVGTLIWAYTLLLPSMFQDTQFYQYYFAHGLFAQEWLTPTALFGIQIDFISHGVLMSLGLNILVFIYFSLTSSPSMSEQVQARNYISTKLDADNLSYGGVTPLTLGDVRAVLGRFFGKAYANRLLNKHYPHKQLHDEYTITGELEAIVEQELAGVIGGPSARLLLNSAKSQRQALVNDVVDIVDEASELLRFNRSLLQATIQNVNQGISVVDKELRLVAWNRRYIEMFNYPEQEIYVGRPVEEIIRFNANRGFFGDSPKQQEVEKRITFLRQGIHYKFQRIQKSGKVYEMNGNPLPGGGFVTTYADITEFVNTQKALEEINAHLESRVEQRTEDLQRLNKALGEAKQDAEQANINKSRYFAALSHDLLQPFNAANLFSSILQEKSDNEETRELSKNISHSLENAEQLLSSILELTKLDAGTISPHIDDFYLGTFLSPICEEFNVLAEEKGLQFKADFDNVGTRSDKNLLRRVIQNLLTNAIRYTEKGKVELTLKRQDASIFLSIKDSGIGIREEDQQRIFNDFEQINQNKEQGLGLGLAITSRICKILGIELTLNSTYGIGSEFTIQLPIITLTEQPSASESITPVNRQDLQSLKVLVIDNDDAVLGAMDKRLSEWGCQAWQAKDQQTALQVTEQQQPNLIIADYHLDDGVTGLDVVKFIHQELDTDIPIIMNSADHSEEIREEIRSQGFQFLNKPVKPAALKRTIKQLVK
ncbi:PAS domain-containing hybrid sensor histidine kinase/response regulator [Thalassotalea sp. PS06]|uniref:PAS domain-containing hybrid sensor histidine kinase/response regulator n=1 Tax=Thalassotalea sp. PS06 TaxID=2594005 RepID=UPI0011628F91|nr:PAS domain-containing hybrid sensor histidine kinase/response regulator [Thalassotalea sp. PS06]QDP00596.1 response regulator [Thalassotalea sp. PS06]